MMIHSIHIFYLDYDTIEHQIKNISFLLNTPEDKERIANIVASLWIPSENVLRSLDTAIKNPITAEFLEVSIKDVRSQLLKTLCFTMALF